MKQDLIQISKVSLVTNNSRNKDMAREKYRRILMDSLGIDSLESLKIIRNPCGEVFLGPMGTFGGWA